MWMETLFDGVLRVLTPLGPRYVNPSFFERLYLLWIFRNFHTLPVRVLSRGQLRRVDAICSRHGFVSFPGVNGSFETPIIGTLEQRPPVENLPSRRPSESVGHSVAPFAADIQQQQ